MLSALLEAELFRYLLVFARIGAALMVMPGFAGSLVPTRFRLLLALAITVVVAPTVQALLPGTPDQVGSLVLLLIGEVAIGVFLGMMVQMLLAAMNVAGSVIGYQVGLSNAFVFDPVIESQGLIITGFLTNLALLLIFATDLHHLMLRAVVDSYDLFRPGARLPLDAFAEALARSLATSFRIGIQLAAPLLVFGLVFFSGLGLLSRLMPQMSVFFVALPIQLMAGIAIAMIALPATMLWFLRHFEGGLAALLPGR